MLSILNNACLPKAAAGRDFSPLEVSKNEEEAIGTAHIKQRCAEPTALMMFASHWPDGLKSILSK